MKKVNAATITQLSTATAGGVVPSAPPAIEDMVARLRADDPTRAQEFQTLLAKLPQGFALVPVLYTRIEKSHNAQLESEYVLSVRQRFLKFLGQTQQQSLRALGICEHGIARMARGLDPATVSGDRYDLSVDHIIERNGSGALSNARAKDPLRAADNAESWPVNHFDNLILMQQDIHDYKNRLNALQGIGQMRVGESRWILSLAPVVTAQSPGFVASVQPAGATLGQLRRYAPNVQQQIGENSAISNQLGETFDVLHHETSIGAIVSMLDTIARHHRPASAAWRRAAENENQRKIDEAYLRQGQTIADLGVAQPRTGQQQAANNNHPRSQRQGRHVSFQAPRVQNVPSAPATMRAIFNAAASHDRDGARVVARDLRPRLRELTEMLEKTYARVETLDIRNPGHQNYDDFVQFFRGRNLRLTCLHASRYPLAESRDLLTAYRRIDTAIARRRGHGHNTPKGFKSFKKTG